MSLEERGGATGGEGQQHHRDDANMQLLSDHRCRTWFVVPVKKGKNEPIISEKARQKREECVYIVNGSIYPTEMTLTS